MTAARVRPAARAFPIPEIVALGPGAGPRRDSLVAACMAELGRPPRLIAWEAFLADPGLLDTALHAGAYLRIDTPDQDRRAIAALYRAGEATAAAAGIETVPANRADRLAHGDVGSPAQLCFGIVAALKLATELAHRHDAAISTTPDEVACAFDKRATLARLDAAGVATPPGLPAPCSFEALVAAMEEARMPRVFVKLRHGSAAAAMIALARHGGEWTAITTAALGADGRVRATRELRRMTDRAEIARLIDRLAPLGLHVERWLPKIGIAGRIADLRLVMSGTEIQPVLRSSRHPMTNLHLGGARGPVDPLVARIGPAAWEALLADARRAAACFPDSHVLGLDIAVLADGTRHAVLEANVFGDFVKDVTAGGLGPHRAQIRRIAARLDARGAPVAEAAA